MKKLINQTILAFVIVNFAGLSASYCQELDTIIVPDSIKNRYIEIQPKDNMVTIPVSDVQIPVIKLKEIKYSDLIPELHAGKIEAYPSEIANDYIVYSKIHPVVGALHYSFAQHRPFSLSPDMVWLMIMQGLAQHFYYNSDSIKEVVYTGKDKTKIQIRRDDFKKGNVSNKWSEVFPEFSSKIKETTNPDLHNLFTHQFSTTTEAISIAYTITMMDALSECYNYGVMTACGIPYVELEGSPEDWKWIKDKLPELRKYELDFWIDNLQPVIDEIYESSTGNVKPEFWKSIYKWNSSSGGDRVTGWIIKFFPYLENDSNMKFVNSYLNFDTYLPDGSKEYYWSGLSGTSFPSGMSACDFNWNYFGKDYPMQFCAGFIGIRQDDDMVLRPEISWFVAEKPETPEIPKSYKERSEENWYLSMLKNGKETDLIRPCYDNIDYMMLEVCDNPDSKPIYNAEEYVDFKTGLQSFVAMLKSDVEMYELKGKAEISFYVLPDGTCVCERNLINSNDIEIIVCEIINGLSERGDVWKPATKDGKPVMTVLKVLIEL